MVACPRILSVQYFNLLNIARSMLTPSTSRTSGGSSSRSVNLGHEQALEARPAGGADGQGEVNDAISRLDDLAEARGPGVRRTHWGRIYVGARAVQRDSECGAAMSDLTPVATSVPHQHGDGAQSLGMVTIQSHSCEAVLGDIGIIKGRIVTSDGKLLSKVPSGSWPTAP